MENKEGKKKKKEKKLSTIYHKFFLLHIPIAHLKNNTTEGSKILTPNLPQNTEQICPQPQDGETPKSIFTTLK